MNCVTLRENTERPSTLDIGTNTLVTRDLDAIRTCLEQPKTGAIPPFWDGRATHRILDILA